MDNGTFYCNNLAKMAMIGNWSDQRNSGWNIVGRPSISSLLLIIIKSMKESSNVISVDLCLPQIWIVRIWHICFTKRYIAMVVPDQLQTTDNRPILYDVIICRERARLVSSGQNVDEKTFFLQGFLAAIGWRRENQVSPLSAFPAVFSCIRLKVTLESSIVIPNRILKVFVVIFWIKTIHPTNSSWALSREPLKFRLNFRNGPRGTSTRERNLSRRSSKEINSGTMRRTLHIARWSNCTNPAVLCAHCASPQRQWEQCSGIWYKTMRLHRKE